MSSSYDRYTVKANKKWLEQKPDEKKKKKAHRWVGDMRAIVNNRNLKMPVDECWRTNL